MNANFPPLIPIDLIPPRGAWVRVSTIEGNKIIKIIDRRQSSDGRYVVAEDGERYPVEHLRGIFTRRKRPTIEGLRFWAIEFRATGKSRRQFERFLRSEKIRGYMLRQGLKIFQPVQLPEPEIPQVQLPPKQA